MELNNRTPFSPFVFESQDVEGDRSIVLVLRGTFKIVCGQTLQPQTKQHPCVISDVYCAEPLTSPLRQESDLVPVKHRIDVTLTGTAYSPQEQPASHWEASVEVASQSSSLLIYGPRFWNYRLLTGWQLSDPDPTACVVLDYSLAFGGAAVESESETSVFDLNPIGCGYSTRKSREEKRSIRAPQIESPDSVIRDIEKDYLPKCFAPIPKHWPQRLKFAGTYDDEWLENRWPQWPLNFDPLYFNSAHPELQLDTDLTPDHKFRFSGIHPNGSVNFHIPDYTIEAAIRNEYGGSEIRCFLDTVEIDADKMEVGLVWRGSDITLGKIERVDVNMSGTGVRTNA